jgi:ACR3 family arsenite efflux pump ArsB
MWKGLAFLQKHLVWSIPTAMALGVLFGYLFDPTALRAMIIPLTFLMVYPMMVTLNIKEVFSGDDTKLQLTTQLMNFALLPFIGWAIGQLFFAERPLIVLGLLLTSLLPTSGMTISWTGFAKGNISAALKMTVIGLVLGSIATPLYLKLLMGAVVAIPLSEVFRQIILIVFLPMAAGYATQRFLIWRYGQKQYQTSFKPKFPALSTLGVLGIVFTAMALKSAAIIADPAVLLRLLLPLLFLYALNFTLSTIVGKTLFKRGDAIALVYGTVMRNLSIALAVAMTAFGADGSEIALIIALAYIIQVQAAAWYVKFTDKIFGSSAEPTLMAQPAKLGK